MEPAALPGLLGRGGVFQVAGEEAPARVRPRAADDELALDAARHLAILGVHHPRLEVALRPAEGAGRDLPGLDVVGEDAAGLRHPPHLDQRKAEALLEQRVQVRLDAGAEAELHRVPPLLRHRRLV